MALSAGMVLAFWWPTLAGGQSLIHGDSIVHGLPLLDLLARALHGDASVLWSDGVHGGHPLFAESQGGFAHPLNLLIAWFVPPVYGHNLFHFACMLLAASGTLGLCRSLGTSPWAGGFAALAVVFSAGWLHEAQNLSISGALAWTPFILWALNAWVRAADLRTAVMLAASASLCFLAGYPQALHATAIYAFAWLAVHACTAEGRERLAAGAGRLLTSGSFAVLLTLGLCAVQLLPMLELVSLSHRKEGVDLAFYTELQAYWRGFLMVPGGQELSPELYFPAAGSLLVCAFASLAPLLRSPSRVAGHLVATALLIGLGMGGSPVYNLFHDTGLIPGLRFFRIAHLYLSVSVIGLAVLAAFALDGIARGALKGTRADRRLRLACLVVLAATWVVVLDRLDVASLAWASLVCPVLALVGVALALAFGRAAWAAPFLCIMLAAECAWLRIHPFPFADASLLRAPAVLGAMGGSSPADGGRIVSRTSAVLYAMGNPNHPGIDQRMQRMLASMSAMTNLLWGVPSLDGALALKLRSRALLDGQLEMELAGQATQPPGHRMLDLLNVRYLATDSPAAVPGFRQFFHDQPFDMWIMENTAARPRFQVFTRHVEAASGEQALDILRTHGARVLVLQPEPGQPPPPDAAGERGAEPRLDWELLETGATRHVLAVNATGGAWLFLADANYPGWSAAIDGVSATVFTADVLGKAVYVPAGARRVVFEFVPVRFYLGALVSLFSLSIAMLVMVRRATAR